MNLLYHSQFLDHITGEHPENAKRFGGFSQLTNTENMPDGRPYLALVHTRDHIRQVEESCKLSKPLDADTKTCPLSFEVAAKGVGATLMAMQQGDFAIIRPPGHHAYANRASGFCLFNNIAIAASHLVNEGKRVCIIDFDGHLGDGTMDIFYESDKVLFISLHQYPAFPGHGFVDEIGVGHGRGFTINVPLPPFASDNIFKDALGHLWPIIDQFNPDRVGISAGFDAHLHDPLLELNATVHTYHYIGKTLKERYGQKVFAVLEGGYNPAALLQSVHAFHAGFEGSDWHAIQEEGQSGMRAMETYEMRIHALLGHLKPFWTI